MNVNQNMPDQSYTGYHQMTAYPGYQQPVGYPPYQQGMPPLNLPPIPNIPEPPSGTAPPGMAAEAPSFPVTPGQLPLQQSYIENILRLNLGKMATIYMTFENNTEWNAKIFKGRLEAAGRDHIIISDPNTGKRYLLLMVNLDYITFDEPLYYTYPYQIGNPPS